MVMRITLTSGGCYCGASKYAMADELELGFWKDGPWMYIACGTKTSRTEGCDELNGG